MRNLLALAVLTVAASGAYSAQLLINSIPTPGQLGANGYHTFTLSLLTEGSESFRGVDATFTGAMNQINPAGNSTIFNDYLLWWEWIGIDRAFDSHFLFSSSTLLTIGAQESSIHLKAAISGLADNGLPDLAPFAQIVAKNGAVSYSLAFDAGLPEPVRFVSAFPLTSIPEPSNGIIAGLALVGVAVRRQGRG